MDTLCPTFRSEQALIMTVDAGFGHQRFLSSALAKIRRVRWMIERIKAECELEVDGGIDPKTPPLAVVAGANVLVAHLFYVSTPASIAHPIIEGLSRAGLNHNPNGWSRIVLEKLGETVWRRSQQRPGN